MLDCYMGQCASDAAFRPISSLNAAIELSQGSEFRELIDIVHSYELNVDEQVIQAELASRLQLFVQSLPTDLRKIARAHFWENQSQADIARAAGVTRSAVCHAVH